MLCRFLLDPTDRPLSRFIPAAFWMLVIFSLSSIPGDRYPRVDLANADKGVHAVLFLPLGWLFARAAKARAAARWRLAAAVAAGVLYGALDEFHQMFVPKRSCSLADWLVDCVAVAAGAGLWVAWRMWRERRGVSSCIRTAPLRP
jgi:VanZ family protein